MVEFISADLWIDPGFRLASTDNNKRNLQESGCFLHFRLVTVKKKKQDFSVILCVEYHDKMLKFLDWKKSFFGHFFKSEKLKWKP